LQSIRILSASEKRSSLLPLLPKHVIMGKFTCEEKQRVLDFISAGGSKHLIGFQTAD
jgi:hypothetical protein